MKAMLPVFLSIFLAELGDKTQLATLLFATERQLARWQVFAAASAALVLSTLIAVLIGEQLTALISPKALKVVAGLGFVAIGVWTLWKG
ncbi:MAG: TMEM165/GDT1 family protein [Candidatus Methylomirabilis sp.]|nr:MAG: TMEM165/GDT1 family protein [bacterium]MBZ0252939.1 TMEM165/GDT1 family protein [Deltaproteobacteria bacterium]